MYSAIRQIVVINSMTFQIFLLVNDGDEFGKIYESNNFLLQINCV